MNLITSHKDLTAFCEALAAHRYITVDTEFLREHTFWPKLCLIQAAAPGIEGMIDPLVEDLDLTPFYDLLTNPKILKVMHGCRQDIEIFYRETKTIPAPLFDTQIAAMTCGFGDAVGYETLVKKTSGEKIDKGSRFTDWSQRPLSEEQLRYAVADVTHLRDAYEFLAAQIEKNNRAHWVKEEMDILNDPSIYEQHPEYAWKRLRMTDRRPQVLGVLIEIAQWRDTQAQEANIPRGRILKDDAIREIAVQRPKDKKALARLRSLPRGFEKSRHAEPLLAAIHKGLSRPQDSLPELSKPVVNKPNIDAIVELLKVLLKHICLSHNVAPKLIANVADLERIASDDEPDVACLDGWRYDIFGQYALKLKTGKLAISLDENKTVLVERPD